MTEHSTESAGIPIPTVCIGCGHPDPTGLHIASCADAQRKLREPIRFTPIEDQPAERAPGAAPRLTQLAPDLWVDLSEIVSVRTYTAQGSYSRVVVLLTRSGVEHKVTVPGTSGGSKPVSVGDRLLGEWLAENLAPVLFPPGLNT